MLSDMRLISAAQSDVGCVREENEDCFLHDIAAAAYGIADGIGGLPFGAEAARCAVDTLLQLLRSRRDDGIATDLVPLVLRVNEAVLQMGRLMSPERGMGCTLSFGCIRSGILSLAHVGDSRCYVHAGGRLLRLTVDHNVEYDPLYRLPPRRLLTLSHAHRGALTRCIGQPTALEVDTLDRELTIGETYLFCTDGITRLVEDQELEAILGNATAEPAEMLDAMIETAKRRGGYDNATGVVLQVR